MNWGDFQSLFRGVAWKRLTAHEVQPEVSNGHEFQGVNKLRLMLGNHAVDRIPTTYVLLDDEQDKTATLELWASWYDSRAGDSSRSSEWRLYYPKEAELIQQRMKSGDFLVAAVTLEGRLLLMLAKADSTTERQLKVLFGISEAPNPRMSYRSYDTPVPIDFTSAMLLEQLGIHVASAPSGSSLNVISEVLERLLVSHEDQLPEGRDVSLIIREQTPWIDERQDPDVALATWIELETAVFLAWEDHKIARRLTRGFVLENGEPDVDSYRKFSMSLRQSRVTRAGGALQYHFEALLDAWRVPYAPQKVVDGGEKPDFLLPSLEAYNDLAFPSGLLRMVAAKNTTKDRWRQVLNEAERIPNKHLLTMDAAISHGQLGLMLRANLTVVVPLPVQSKYPQRDQQNLTTVREFLGELSTLKEHWERD